MKTIATLLAAILFLNTLPSALSSAPRAEPSSTAAAIQKQVRKRGAGEKSHVKVSMRDGSEIKGYISKIEDSSFEVTDQKTGTRKSIAYVDVAKVRNPRLSAGTKIVIVVGVVVLVVVISYAVAVASLGRFGG